MSLLRIQLAQKPARYHWGGWDAKLALPAHDISLGHPGDAQTISARVQAHEWIGRELQIVVTIDGSRVRLRTQQRLGLRIGDQIAIRLNFERAHAFDSKTGRALRSNTV
jgi:ABC-type sugar transport system ATPase subunit